MVDQETPNLHAGDCILTYSGHYLNVFDPNPDDIDIRDIAHALSNVPRFAGHTEKIINVADHSINVSYGCAPDVEDRIAGLLHDASEAYLMDIPKPIKRHLPDYKALEDRLMKAIADKFGFVYPLSVKVKAADREQLEYEHEYLRVRKGMIDESTPYEVRTSQQSEKDFLEIFEMLMQLRKEASHV